MLPRLELIIARAGECEDASLAVEADGNTRVCVSGSASRSSARVLARESHISRHPGRVTLLMCVHRLSGGEACVARTLAECEPRKVQWHACAASRVCIEEAGARGPLP